MNNIFLDSIDSTNSYAKKHVDQFPKNTLTCIWAEEQTAGRGRFQRKWISPRGKNIYVTFYFRLPRSATHLSSIGQVLAISLAHVLIGEKLSPQIKWPNDILLSGKKLAGVLCETEFHTAFVDIFLGIGINVNMEPDELSAINQPATSLFAETNHQWDRKILGQKLQETFASDLEKFKKAGFAPFHSLFEELLTDRGKTIRCFDGKKEWIGTYDSIASGGELNIRLPNGEIHTLLSGEVTRANRP